MSLVFTNNLGRTVVAKTRAAADVAAGAAGAAYRTDAICTRARVVKSGNMPKRPRSIIHTG
jgi:hypothetical protein